MGRGERGLVDLCVRRRRPSSASRSRTGRARQSAARSQMRAFGTASSRSSCSRRSPPRNRSIAQPAATYQGTATPRAGGTRPPAATRPTPSRRARSLQQLHAKAPLEPALVPLLRPAALGQSRVRLRVAEHGDAERGLVDGTPSTSAPRRFSSLASSRYAASRPSRRSRSSSARSVSPAQPPGSSRGARRALVLLGQARGDEPQHRRRIRLRSDPRIERVACDPLGQRCEDPALRAEAVVDRLHGDPRRFGEIVDARPRVAALSEERARPRRGRRAGWPPAPAWNLTLLSPGALSSGARRRGYGRTR